MAGNWTGTINARIYFTNRTSLGGAVGSTPAARAADHRPISVFQGRWQGGNVSFQGGSVVKPSREVMSGLHQGPHLLTPGSPVPTAGLKDPETHALETTRF